MSEKVCGYCGENIWPGTPYRVVGDMDEPFIHWNCYELMEEEGLISH